MRGACPVALAHVEEGREECVAGCEGEEGRVERGDGGRGAGGEFAGGAGLPGGGDSGEVNGGVR